MKKIRFLLVALLCLAMLLPVGCRYNPNGSFLPAGGTPSASPGTSPGTSPIVSPSAGLGLTSKEALDELLNFASEESLGLMSMYTCAYDESKWVTEPEEDSWKLVDDDQALDGKAIQIHIKQNYSSRYGISFDVSACNLKMSEIDHIYIRFRFMTGDYMANQWGRISINKNVEGTWDANTFGSFKVSPGNYLDDQVYSLLSKDELKNNCSPYGVPRLDQDNGDPDRTDYSVNYEDFIETINFHFLGYGIKEGIVNIDYIKIVSIYEVNE